MKKRRATVVEFHYDILKEILIRVARSSDGARNLAKAFVVCKAFREFVEDGDILRAVVGFDNLRIPPRWKLFRLTQGLLNRCAQAGHTEAQFILAKIILVSTSQLLQKARAATDIDQEYRNPHLDCLTRVATDIDQEYRNPYLDCLTRISRNDNLFRKEISQVSSFMENLLPDEHRSCPHGLYHFDMVRLFLSRANFVDHDRMKCYLNDYMEYFLGYKGNKQALLVANLFHVKCLLFTVLQYIEKKSMLIEKERPQSHMIEDTVVMRSDLVWVLISVFFEELVPALEHFPQHAAQLARDVAAFSKQLTSLIDDVQFKVKLSSPFEEFQAILISHFDALSS